MLIFSRIMLGGVIRASVVPAEVPGPERVADHLSATGRSVISLLGDGSRFLGVKKSEAGHGTDKHGRWITFRYVLPSGSVVEARVRYPRGKGVDLLKYERVDHVSGGGEERRTRYCVDIREGIFSRSVEKRDNSGGDSQWRVVKGTAVEFDVTKEPSACMDLITEIQQEICSREPAF